MKFNVESRALYAQTSAVSKVINSKNPMPILNNFLLELHDNKLTITASDIENTLSASLMVTEAEGSGRVCVDARRLIDLLKSMPDIGITFDINDETLAIAVSYNGDKGKFDFVGISGDEYPTPQVQTDENACNFSIKSDVILNGIDNTIFAVGSDTLRPMMMGIYWDIKPDSFAFVATDTRKLVCYRSNDVEPGVECHCIIPTKPAQVIKNVLQRDRDVRVSIDDKRCMIITADMCLSCQLIKGNFPDYTRVIPRNNPYQLTIDRQSFLSSLRRVSVFGDQGQNLVKLRITPSELTIKAVDNNYCTSAVETIPCDFNHSEMVIGFSAGYLMEFFSTLSSSEVEVALSDPSRPGVFTNVNQAEGTDLLMLLMPMNVSEF